MDEPSKYWTFVRLTAAGKPQVIEVEPAKGFFRREFPHLVGQTDIAHNMIQLRLHQLYDTTPIRGDEMSESWLAECCLRCFISNRIEQVCSQIQKQFGKQHGFTQYDLLPYVLNDGDLTTTGRRRSSNSQNSSDHPSLATEILQTFTPKRGNLGSWVTRLVRHHKGLNNVLLEHGVYLLSDWAILNDTRIPQLERILTEFCPLPRHEVFQASVLLESYHAIYRRDRMKHRQANRRCLPPSNEQLCRMKQWMQNEFSMERSPDQIVAGLQDLAQHLRDYRIFVRSNYLPVQSMDDPDHQTAIESIQMTDENDEEDEINEFLHFYRQQFDEGLNQAIAKVIQQRIEFLKRKRNPKHHVYLTGLQLFHCQGLSMSAIAPHIGLQRQDQVTYLLKLKSLRADVRHTLLTILRDRILKKAQDYIDPERLHHLDQQIDDALESHASAVIEEAQDEASTARNQPLRSVFARQLCRHLDKLMIDSPPSHPNP
ncbi:MAG: hypothetical protein ACFE0J_12355 [Elainellaceae cyanobacterium]